jgi:hypothetical protein
MKTGHTDIPKRTLFFQPNSKPLKKGEGEFSITNKGNRPPSVNIQYNISVWLISTISFFDFF